MSLSTYMKNVACSPHALQNDAVFFFAFPRSLKLSSWMGGSIDVARAALWCGSYMRLSHVHDNVLKLYPDLRFFYL